MTNADAYDAPVDGCGEGEELVLLDGVGQYCGAPCVEHDECGPPLCGNASTSCAGTDGDANDGADPHCMLFCSPPDQGTPTECPPGSECVPYDDVNIYYVCIYPL